MTLTNTVTIPTAAQNARVVKTGVTDGSDASAGQIGEAVSSMMSFGNAQGLSTGVAFNLFTLSLTAGDWDVEANVNFSMTSATSTDRSCGINTTSQTIPSDGTGVSSAVQTTTATVVDGLTIPRKRVSLAATSNVYVVAKSTFAAGSVAVYGGVTARRVR